MATKKAKATKLDFQDVQAIYGLSDPDQIKLRIIWLHIQSVILALSGNDPSNVKRLGVYDKHFKLCEKEINSSIAKTK
jgi:hypothetical protein